MDNLVKIKTIKDEIASLSKQIVEKRYETLDEKHELQKKRWLLKRMLSAIEKDEDCRYLDLFMPTEWGFRTNGTPVPRQRDAHSA